MSQSWCPVRSFIRIQHGGADKSRACDVPRFIEQICALKQIHTHKRKIKNNVIELGYREDIKIDKDIRFLLRQEMKEMDWVVFHTSHSLSIPLRRTPPLSSPLPPSHADFLEKRQNPSVWNEVSDRGADGKSPTVPSRPRTDSHTARGVRTLSLLHPQSLSDTHTHTQMCC